MHPASVGFHCPSCTSRTRATVVNVRDLVWRPLVTQALIAVNVVAFVWAVATGGSLDRIGFDALVDGGLIGGGIVQRGGGFEVIGVAEGEWWRLVTGAFLHDGLFHLGFNMWALWILGSQLERVLGRARFAALYVGSLLAGAFGVLLVSPEVPTVGASGAVFGLMGAALVVQKAAGIDPWSSGLGAVIAINLLITLAVPRISLGGHVGGLVGGVLIGTVLVESIRRRWEPAVALVATGVLAVAFVAGSVWAAGTWTDPLF